MALRGLWQVFKVVEGLIALEAKYDEELSAVRANQRALDGRVARLESRDDLAAVEARAAARMGAADAMQGVILEIGERLANRSRTRIQTSGVLPHRPNQHP